MCLIIAQTIKADALLETHLRSAWHANPDGVGYAFVDHDGTLVVRKAFFALQAFIAAYRADYEAYGETSPFLIHFRWATTGSNTDANTHPFIIARGDAVLAHNGVLDVPTLGDESDTVAFCRMFLKDREVDKLVRKRSVRKLANRIGDGNKFAILSRDREITIVNEDAGFWERGVWFSNHSHTHTFVRTSKITHVKSSGTSKWRYRHGYYERTDGVALLDATGPVADCIGADLDAFDPYIGDGVSCASVFCTCCEQTIPNTDANNPNPVVYDVDGDPWCERCAAEMLIPARIGGEDCYLTVDDAEAFGVLSDEGTPLGVDDENYAYVFTTPCDVCDIELDTDEVAGEGHSGEALCDDCFKDFLDLEGTECGDCANTLTACKCDPPDAPVDESPGAILLGPGSERVARPITPDLSKPGSPGVCTLRTFTCAECGGDCYGALNHPDYQANEGVYVCAPCEEVLSMPGSEGGWAFPDNA